MTASIILTKNLVCFCCSCCAQWMFGATPRARRNENIKTEQKKKKLIAPLNLSIHKSVWVMCFMLLVCCVCEFACVQNKRNVAVVRWMGLFVCVCVCHFCGFSFILRSFLQSYSFTLYGNVSFFDCQEEMYGVRAICDCIYCAQCFLGGWYGGGGHL